MMMNITRDYNEIVEANRNEYPRYKFKCEKYSPIHKCSIILNEINEKEIKMEEISLRSKKSSAFNDKHLKYSNVSNDIKKSLMDIERDINTLKMKEIPKANLTSCERQLLKNCIELLNSKASDLTMKFKKFLEEQTILIKSVEEKKKNSFSHYDSKGSSTSLDDILFDNGSSILGNNDIELNIRGGGTSLATESKQDNYYKTRLSEVQSIEKIMSEVSGMMNRMSEMIYHHSLLIDNIDKNTDLVYGNVTAGSKDIKSMFDDVKGNRSLLIKIFLIIIVTAVIYIVFMA